MTSSIFIYTYSTYPKQYMCKEYIAFTNYSTLKNISHLKEKGETAVCIAAFVAGVRLIDNIIF